MIQHLTVCTDQHGAHAPMPEPECFGGPARPPVRRYPRLHRIARNHHLAHAVNRHAPHAHAFNYW
ncbi:MAG: hypothetical protein EB039_08220 [Proteobacteria bacterium]|nr:hypothetical protein [Pseudomonadota bacterium]